MHKSMPTGELDSMKRLWDKQRSNMDGHQLISDDELMKAINASNVSKTMTWKTWQRVAAVAVVVIATLWPTDLKTTSQSIGAHSLDEYSDTRYSNCYSSRSRDDGSAAA